jgi:hypothetical protein
VGSACRLVQAGTAGGYYLGVITVHKLFGHPEPCAGMIFVRGSEAMRRSYLDMSVVHAYAYAHMCRFGCLLPGMGMLPHGHLSAGSSVLCLIGVFWFDLLV